MGATREFTRSVKVDTGIEARYSKTCNSLRVIFWYKKVECRETLQIEPTPANIKYAIRLRAEILNTIERNTFSYPDFFPNSKRARLFGHVVSKVTVGEQLQEFLVQAKTTQQLSTYESYRKVCKGHLIPTFGKILLTELTPMVIRKWVRGLKLTRKTVTNILIPLRAILEEAVNDDRIMRNPLDRVVLAKLLNKETADSDYEADPFNKTEIQAILATAQGQARHLFQFAFYSGLRSSELIALQWKDIDWDKGQVHVQRAVVVKKEKCTKTLAGDRFVLLLPPALEALKSQMAYTFKAGERVFHNPRTGQGWETDGQIRKTCWTPILKRAGVRYRNPYQTRHTYASMLLSAGENMLWVAKQMGHRDTEMLIKTYGKWIPNTEAERGYTPLNDWSEEGMLSTITSGIATATPHTNVDMGSPVNDWGQI